MDTTTAPHNNSHHQHAQSAVLRSQDLLLNPYEFPRRSYSDLPGAGRYSGVSEEESHLFMSSGQPSDSALKFLHAVKHVQVIQRLDKLRRVKSARGGSHFRPPQPPPEQVPATVPENESTPLVAPTGPEEALAPRYSAPVPDESGLQKLLGDPDDSPPPVKPWEALMSIIFGKGWISAMLLAAPVVLVAVHAHWSDTAIFWLSFCVMIPLASILGDFTEEVALHTNETIGGLINASFGNAVELVVAIQALLANEIRVVQASMLGSIFSNLLLVLGGCLFFGGLYHSEQTFNSTAATANMGLLALSSIALVLPTPFAAYYNLHDEHVLVVSRIAAIFLMFMYIQLLIFQLRTHAHLFQGAGGGPEEGGSNTAELASMSLAWALMGLLVTTLLVTIFSEFLVKSIDGFTTASGISRTFVGIILLPIVGNAVEHITAVTVAIKDKMDLAMGVAVGSCTQISLFVVPLTVLVGWATGRPMNLNFPQFEVILFILSVFTVSVVLSYPKCNWLEGSLLMTTYMLIAVGFWFENVKNF